jgi:NAD(P)-dependent dehydrogenase (short-subunit alcohol dehydrogenase family)
MGLAGMSDKVAVVTGAASGIGAATAHRLVGEGVRVACVDRDKKQLDILVEELGDVALSVVADVSEPNAATDYIDRTVEHFGRFDMFHANAGILGPVADFVDISDDDFDRVVAINIRGTFFALRAAMRKLSGSGGSIVATSSIQGIRGAQGSVAYTAAKHAVIGMVRTAAIEGGPLNIRVNAVAPGTVETPMLDELQRGILPDDPAKAGQLLRSRAPLGRDATAAEIAATVAWLLSDESSYVSGAVMSVDGGATA